MKNFEAARLVLAVVAIGRAVAGLLRVERRTVSALEHGEHGLTPVEAARILVVRVVAGLRAHVLARRGANALDGALAIVSCFEDPAVDLTVREQVTSALRGHDFAALRLSFSGRVGALAVTPHPGERDACREAREPQET